MKGAFIRVIRVIRLAFPR